MSNPVNMQIATTDSSLYQTSNSSPVRRTNAMYKMQEGRDERSDALRDRSDSLNVPASPVMPLPAVARS